MKNLFSRTPVNTDVRPLALTEHRTDPGRITPISNPDTRMPLPHAANQVDPHDSADSFRTLVRQKVGALAAAGALDQDNLEALSQEISSWLATWRQKVEQEHTSRTEIAQLLLAQTVQDKAVVSRELTTMRSALAEITDARARILRGWGFAARTDAGAAAPSAAPATASRVLAVSRAETTADRSSDRELAPGTEVTAPPVIGFPVAAPADGRSDSDSDSEELSA